MWGRPCFLLTWETHYFHIAKAIPPSTLKGCYHVRFFNLNLLTLVLLIPDVHVRPLEQFCDGVEGLYIQVQVESGVVSKIRFEYIEDNGGVQMCNIGHCFG